MLIADLTLMELEKVESLSEEMVHMLRERNFWILNMATIMDMGNMQLSLWSRPIRANYHSMIPLSSGGGRIHNNNFTEVWWHLASELYFRFVLSLRCGLFLLLVLWPSGITSYCKVNHFTVDYVAYEGEHQPLLSADPDSKFRAEGRSVSSFSGSADRSGWYSQG